MNPQFGRELVSILVGLRTYQHPLLQCRPYRVKLRSNKEGPRQYQIVNFQSKGKLIVYTVLHFSALPKQAIFRLYKNLNPKYRIVCEYLLICKLDDGFFLNSQTYNSG